MVGFHGKPHAARRAWCWALAVPPLALLVAVGGCSSSDSASSSGGTDGGVSDSSSLAEGGDSSGGADTGLDGGGDSGSKGDADSGAVVDSGSDGSADSGSSTGVTIFAAPSSTLEGRIVHAIEGATTSVHMTMYILDDSAIVNALVAREHAGLDVRVVLNQTFPSGTTETNPTTYSTLTAAGVGVVWRNGPPGATAGAYTRESTFILDGAQAWIMTLDLDATSFEDNRDYVVVDNQAADVVEADSVFLADYAGTSTTSGAPLVVSPAPPDNSRSRLVALIGSATRTLDVEVEQLTDNGPGGVTAAVAAAAMSGVATRIILANATASAAQTTAIATVKAAGAHVVVSGGAPGAGTSANPYIHASAVTVDCTGTTCAMGFVGSENLTSGSLGENRELGVIVTDSAQLATVQADIDADFSAGTAQ